MPLTTKTVEKIIRDAQPGATADSGGLYLKIGPTGAASWQYRFQLAGKRRMMGLGACALITLAQARDAAAEARRLASAGIDPIEARIQAAVAACRQKITFSEAAREYVEGRAAGWSNAKHADQWRTTLATYGKPFAEKPVAAVTIDDVEAALRPIWLDKTETATRVLKRIVAVLAYAHDKGWRDDDDADTWAHRLRRRLPMLPKKTARVRHHPALHFTRVPVFFAELLNSSAMGSRALAFAILCASRSSEVRLAQWKEIDEDSATWIMPAERMKARMEHRVPLSRQALQILTKIKPRAAKPGTYVFPGARPSAPLSDMTLNAFIRRANQDTLVWADDAGVAIVQHGFRSSFRDWAAETTPYPRDVAEMALAHTISDRVEAAYRRGDLFEKRRQMMQDWADYCCPNGIE